MINTFDKDFEKYKQENPDWNLFLTDSTYYELMDWYDAKHGLGDEDSNSDEARSFASYVWSAVSKPYEMKMIVVPESVGRYSLLHMDIEHLQSLVRVISSGGLADGRIWYSVKKEIEEILKGK